MGEAKLNYCHEGGALVSGDASVPADPTVYAPHALRLVDLPLEMGGVAIDARTDLGALARRVLCGWSPLSAVVPDQNEAWLALLYSRLAGHELAHGLAQAVAHCVTDDDPHVKGGVFRFFLRHPFASGHEGVVTAAATSSAPAEYPYYCTSFIPGDDSTEDIVSASALVAGYLGALREDDPRRSAFQVLLRALLLRPGATVSKDTYLIVGRADPGWICGHARAEAHPTLWHAILSCLLPAGEEKQVLAGRAIIDSGRVDHGEIEGWLDTHFPRYRWADILREALTDAQR